MELYVEKGNLDTVKLKFSIHPYPQFCAITNHITLNKHVAIHLFEQLKKLLKEEFDYG